MTAENGGLRPGVLVEHPRRPEWGPGKVAHLRNGNAHVFFRDLPDRRAKVFAFDQLRLASSQTDLVLDNLPPFLQKDGEFYLPAERVTAEQAREKFLRKFPGGFSDPAYLEDPASEERRYKLRAHDHFVTTLGGGQLERLMDEGATTELARRAQQVVSRVNLLAPMEAAAFREGLSDDAAARSFFPRLSELLSRGPERNTFESYAAAVAAVPAKGKTHTDKWTVATILPFFARPDTFMFVKPSITLAAAERLAFDLRYDPRPNWITYERVLRMSSVYADLLKDLGPRDLIDVQSFFWVTGKQYDEVEAAQRAKREARR